jgi:(E)-4-hydroxy-3-methylbut-2-enyl-diphosphate synthase
MTTSDTRDVDATVEQIVKLSDAGCEIARVTVQGIKEAEACEGIKNRLLQKGLDIPLVADIHFYPPAALKAVEFVDKVRINPGNFVDKRASFKVIEYDDASYELELIKIEEKLLPLIEKCKRLKRVIRIGTNHGSLSDRIMNRFGDTPQGMVESALEFARICRKHDFHDFVFSMKASNPQVMILAYRLLAAEQRLLGWDYPLHLGVTEAGEGEDGRIKSAIGIGSLLLDGLGDTIRVSLTEDAWKEIDPCKRLIALAKHYESYKADSFAEPFRNFEALNKRDVIFPRHFAMHKEGTVMLSSEAPSDSSLYKALGHETSLGKPKLKASGADIVYSTLSRKDLEAIGVGHLSPPSGEGIPLLTLNDAKARADLARFTPLSNSPCALLIENDLEADEKLIRSLNPLFIAFAPLSDKVHQSRRFFSWLQQKGLPYPVLLAFRYDVAEEDLVIHAAAEAGSLLADGLGEGLWLHGPYPLETLHRLSFGILQAARRRMIKTDFISCPSCGRTLFDLQEVTRRIKSQTAHLPGVKIAIMGCIVNGPGEMADADFGYVGSRPGMIDLYVGKNCVEKNIPFAEADARLIALLKTHGAWTDPIPA